MAAEAGEQQQENQGAGAGNGGSDSGQGGSQRTYNDDQVNAIVAKARREIESKFEGFDELKQKASQYDQLTESAKSELERATTSASEFKSKWEAEQGKTSKLETQLLRQQISAKNQLDADLWDRVKGTTAEEIESDVKKLVEKFGTTGGGRPSRGLHSGASASEGSTEKQRAAAALRGVRGR